MELLETFSKYEMTLDQSCKKNEKLFFELKDELNMPEELNIELNIKDRHLGGTALICTIEMMIDNSKQCNLLLTVKDNYICTAFQSAEAYNNSKIVKFF